MGKVGGIGSAARQERPPAAGARSLCARYAVSCEEGEAKTVEQRFALFSSNVCSTGGLTA
jgi:hypothetical protein